MPRYAVECNNRLIDIPFLTRRQAEEEMDVLRDETPQMPVVEIFVLVPVLVWEDTQDRVEELEDKVEW